MRSDFWIPLFLYLLCLNLLAFFACAWDKRLARQHRWRISERALLAFALFGGAAGMLLAMHLFRHKTQHRKFTILVPMFLFLELFLLLFFSFSRGAL